MAEIMIAETAVPGGRNLHQWWHYEQPPWMIAIMIAVMIA
jgi:hypothetical protein